MRIENREVPAETKTVQEPHSLVISHESLLSLERGSLRVFSLVWALVGGLKLESCFGLYWLPQGLPDLVNDGACLRLDMKFFRLGSGAAV